MRSYISILSVSAILLLGPLQTDGAELLRDPTRPYSARAVVPSSVGSFVVSAIFVSKDRRVAIVNGQRVIEGDQIDGATVIEILADSLRINFHGKEISTRLLPAGLRN